eukprot:11488374-Ditylum_brightwellii.AAC.1
MTNDNATSDTTATASNVNNNNSTSDASTSTSSNTFNPNANNTSNQYLPPKFANESRVWYGYNEGTVLSSCLSRFTLGGYFYKLKMEDDQIHYCIPEELLTSEWCFTPTPPC